MEVIDHYEYARKLRKYLLLCVKLGIAPNMQTVNDAKRKLIDAKK